MESSWTNDPDPFLEIMLNSLKQIFNDTGTNPGTDSDQQQELNVAVCALLVEMGRIDQEFSDDELDHIVSIMTEKFSLSREHADALIAEAELELQNSVDLWQFASVINNTFSQEKKTKLIERLWEVVYVDGKMDSHEHYLMGKMSKLLRISHTQLIGAKIRAQKRML